MINIGGQIKKELSALHNEGVDVLLYEAEEKGGKVKREVTGDIKNWIPYGELRRGEAPLKKTSSPSP